MVNKDKVIKMIAEILENQKGQAEKIYESGNQKEIRLMIWGDC